MPKIELNIITIFPGYFNSPLSESILQKAVEKELINILLYDLRDFAHDKHKIVDDSPYGGGPGMVMKPEPLAEALEEINRKKPRAHVILTSPKGALLTQDRLKQLALVERLVIICGRYEGVDERIRLNFVDEEISVGDYVLFGGEAPALVLIEGIARMIPGVVGNTDSLKEDSFFSSMLDHPHYTRPAEFKGLKVPSVLMGGNHLEIKKWRRKEALKITWQERPDLISQAELGEEDLKILEEIKKEKNHE